MKQAAIALGLAWCTAVPSHALKFLGVRRAQESSPEAPVTRVLKLIAQLKEHTIADGKEEQKSYDKFACWCEDTLGRKAKDISEAKVQIEELGSLLVKLKAEIASHGAEIEQTKKDLAGNVEARREATELRDKEHAEYQDDKTSSEQCIGALESAIKVLAGAGTKKGFLETMQEAQLLSIVAGVRTVLARPSSRSALSGKDLSLVKMFVEKPEDFIGSSTGYLSAVQTANNPFGDYAPQSTQIQGILKGMYDTFVGDLEKGNAEEAEAQKSHEELMQTKEMEAATLQATLEQHTLDAATKGKNVADSQEILDATKEQLEADEKFFADTKEGCQVKASQWSERTRLRTEELAGIGKCLEILSSDEAKATFGRSATTLLQLASTPRMSDQRVAAVSKLTQLAARYSSSNMKRMAQLLKAGGHFDKVMASIDAMIEVLRREEQEDIGHRDRCQGADNKNKNNMEDLTSHIEKTSQTIQRLEDDASRFGEEIAALKEEINQTRTARDERLALRNKEVEEFRQAQKDDADAVALLEQAVVAMTEFYRQNKLEMGLISKKAARAPEYTEDPDKAPETSWSDANYGGRTSETRGLVAILQMLIEDVRNEMKTAKEDDTEDQQLYEKEDGAMKATLDSQLALKLAKDKELNDIDAKLEDKRELKASMESDLGAETSLKDSIFSDCAWVETHFESRRTSRKAEMDGLAEAKSYLAGVEAGDEV